MLLTIVTTALQTDRDYYCRRHLEVQGIVLDRRKRSERIWQDAQSAAEQEGGLIPEANKTDLLAEVTDLVEAPTVILGRFDPAFLELPE